MDIKVEVVVDNICLLGEGPIWDEIQQSICWVDILNGLIHEYSYASQLHKTIPVHQMIGAIAFCKSGNFIAALQNGFAIIERNTGKIDMIADPEAHMPGNRFNDGKCDPAGRFWAGTISLTEEPNVASLYMLDNDKSVINKIKGLSISNGLAWSRDYQKFYHIDTPTSKVAAFNYDVATGKISNKTTIIEVDKKEGFPDGMTIDTEGMLWIAHWDGWKVSRWNPETGQRLLSIKLPVARVTSCTFGGRDLQDLFITTASKELTKEQLKEQPLAGSLFVVKNCGYTGMPPHRFKELK